MKNSCRRGRSAVLLKKSCLAVLVAVALSANAGAQNSPDAVQYALPAGDLIRAINEVSRSSGMQIVYDIELLRGMSASEVNGSLTLDQALDRVLKGTGLAWKRVNATTISIQKKPVAKKPPSEQAQVTPIQAGSGNVGQQDVEDMDSVIVVGSRLSTSPMESALPIRVLTRDDIQRSGATSVAQALANLSEISVTSQGDRSVGSAGNLNGNTNATAVQLRGLPLGTTLVLINGRRAPGSAALSGSLFDLSVVPVNLVERIEILPAGASAIYGGDGLAGVINIVLRQDAAGTQLDFGLTWSESRLERSVSGVHGRVWSHGSLTLAGSLKKSDGLLSSERAITANQDYRRFGGTDYRTPWSNPANIYSTQGCPAAPDVCEWTPLGARGNLPGLDSPFASVPSGQNGRSLTTQDFRATAGQINDGRLELPLFSPETAAALSMNGILNVSENTEAYADFIYSNRAVPAEKLPLYFKDRVSAENPFNPFGVDVIAEYRYEDTGVFREYKQTTLSMVLGLRGQWKKWKWDISVHKSKDWSDINGPGYFDRNAISAALNSSDQAKALNPFVGDGSAPASQSVIRSLLVEQQPDFSVGIEGGTAYVSGPIFTNWAGTARGLIGGEVKRQSLGYIPADGNTNRIGDLTSNALFAEARVPLWAAKAQDRREILTLSGAFRRESSSHLGQKPETETVGLEWRPTTSLLFRGSYSSAFKPAGLQIVLQEPYVLARYPARDPKFGGQLSYFPALLFGGGLPPDLKPETSKTRTFGVSYMPGSAWRMSATYWNMHFNNRFSSTNPSLLLGMESAFPERIQRDPVTNRIMYVDSRLINISKADISGVDLEASTAFSAWGGELYPAIAATYTYEYVDQVRPGLPLRNNLNVRTGSSWAPRWKIVPRVTWSYRDQISVNALARYISAYKDPVALTTGNSAGKFNTLGNMWHIDASVDLSMGVLFGPDRGWISSQRVQLSVRNLTNRLPKFCNSCGISGYDASQYDIMGRTVSLTVRTNF